MRQNSCQDTGDTGDTGVSWGLRQKRRGRMEIPTVLMDNGTTVDIFKCHTSQPIFPATAPFSLGQLNKGRTIATLMVHTRSKTTPCICKRPRSTASVRHKSPPWNIHGIRLERGRTLDWCSVDSGCGRSQTVATSYNARKKKQRVGHSKKDTMNFHPM